MQKISRIFYGIGQVSDVLATAPGIAFCIIVLLAVVALICSWIVIPKMKWRSASRSTFQRVSVWCTIGIYLLIVLAFMYVMRNPNQGYKLEIIPFYGLRDRALLRTEILGAASSFLLFVPLGILFFCQCRVDHTMAYTLMFSFGTGLAVEFLQYIARMGVFSVEEILCAAVGGTLGGALTLAWQRTKTKKSFGGIILRIVFGICTIMISLGVVAFGTYHVLRIGGEKTIKENISSAPLNMESEDGKESGEADLVWHDGKAYRFNDQVITLLCMGIDQQSDEIQETDDISGESGQADTIFLAVLDPVDSRLSVIAISRDTMTEMATYDAKGNYIGESVNHLGLEYAFGNGKDTSCQYMVNTVSKLFYGIPINGYAAFNMKTISKLNDAVGGVTVTVPEGEDISDELKAGTTVTLTGDTAETFVRYRDNEEHGSNNQRIIRQKQFLINFFSQAVTAMQENVSLPATLYQDFSKEMITNIGLDNAVYLMTEAAGMSFGDENLMVLQGEAKAGDVYDEFYVDDAALYELILNVFYTEVKA